MKKLFVLMAASSLVCGVALAKAPAKQPKEAHPKAAKGAHGEEKAEKAAKPANPHGDAHDTHHE